VISFDLKDDSKELATKIVTSTKYFKLAESLGGVKSLCCLPCEMTHKSIPQEKRYAAGVTDSLIRISVGLEDAEDLIADLKQAFAISKQAVSQAISAAI
jgi:cystathionine beta-lyase